MKPLWNFIVDILVTFLYISYIVPEEYYTKLVKLITIAKSDDRDIFTLHSLFSPSQTKSYRHTPQQVRCPRRYWATYAP